MHFVKFRTVMIVSLRQGIKALDLYGLPYHEAAHEALLDLIAVNWSLVCVNLKYVNGVQDPEIEMLCESMCEVIKCVLQA